MLYFIIFIEITGLCSEVHLSTGGRRSLHTDHLAVPLHPRNGRSQCCTLHKICHRQLEAHFPSQRLHRSREGTKLRIKSLQALTPIYYCILQQGMNNLTEMYSVMKAEVPLEEDSTTQFNRSLMKELQTTSKVSNIS